METLVTTILLLLAGVFLLPVFVDYFLDRHLRKHVPKVSDEDTARLHIYGSAFTNRRVRG